MKRYLFILILMYYVLAPVKAQYYSVNFDTKTVAAMSAAFNTEAATEMYYAFAGKYLDRKALTNLGLWTSSTENYYYRRIYSMVSMKIMPTLDEQYRELLLPPYLQHGLHEDHAEDMDGSWYDDKEPSECALLGFVPA